MFWSGSEVKILVKLDIRAQNNDFSFFIVIQKILILQTQNIPLLLKL